MTHTEPEGSDNPSRFTRFQIALISAIVLVGVLVAAAIWFRGGDSGAQSAASSATPAPLDWSQVPGTCAAWMVVDRAIQDAPMLPSDWRKNFTSETNQRIEERIAAIREPLNKFEAAIVPGQGELTAAAQ